MNLATVGLTAWKRRGLPSLAFLAWAGTGVARRRAAVCLFTLFVLLAFHKDARAQTAPVITSASSFDVEEGTTSVATLAATDADGGTLTWSIPAGGGDDAGHFTLSAAGVLAFGSAKDCEPPDDEDTDGTYEVKLQVSDGADDASHFSIDSPAGALRFDIDPVASNIFTEPPDFDAPADSDTDDEYSITLLARAGSVVSDTPLTVTVTGVLEVTEDGDLTVRTEMEVLGELTISTHGRGDLVTGSVKVLSDSLIGGSLRFDLPDVGEAVVEASSPIREAIFPVRRREGGINPGVAVHNLEEEPLEVSCRLMNGADVLEEIEIPLEANGQTSWLINQAFPDVDTSGFVGSVRCDAAGEGRFSAVALEMDPCARIFTTLPVFPLPAVPGDGR